MAPRNGSIGFRSIVMICALLTYGEVSAAKNIDGSAARAVFPPVTPIRPLPLPAVRDIEERIRPLLESKLGGGIRRLTRAQLPHESDLLLLARAWERLSPEFKDLYESATRIPDTFEMHVSPGDHFEVYYTVGDTMNGVAAVDTIGYGSARDWRIRTHGGNGIPDYIDEVAWAFDSSRSMIVDRFGFIPPLPRKDAGRASGRYRVVISGFGPGNYGLTFPKGKAEGTPRGYSSYIEIRNEWDGAEWGELGYGAHPENGIRVTAAHELFHAAQYAMTWNAPYDVDLDDFRLAWLEGTAVLMEELAFDSINDYLQYTGPFFGNPRMSFFDDAEGAIAYSNSLLVKHLFEKATGAPRIDFIRNVFFTNYTEVTPFHRNVRTTSLAFGIPWAVMLNRFFSASYFSGSRADTSRFLADAGMLGEWNVSGDTVIPPFSITKSVDPYASQLFVVEPDARHGDTLVMEVACRGTDRSWAASYLLSSAMHPDSLFELPIDNDGRAACRIDNWKSRGRLLLFISNGHPSEKKTVTISDPAPAFAIYPNPARLGSGRFVRFAGRDIREVRIYAADGRLVCSSAAPGAGAFHNYNGGFEWRLRNGRGATVAPGCYTALVIRRDDPGNEQKPNLHKVLVYP